MDHPSLYDRDIYAWADAQATVLRSLAESSTRLPCELDVDNLVNEIANVGRTELSRTESFLRLILLHVLKLASAPISRSAKHWAVEIEVFQHDLLRSLTPSIATKAHLDSVWRLARRQASVQLKLEGDTLLPDLPAACPFTVSELATEPFDVEAAISRLNG